MSLSQNRTRYSYIDSIRGLAALGVIYLHMSQSAARSAHPLNAIDTVLFYIATDLLDIGKVSVILFFAVSGFIIPFSLLDKEKRASVRDFVVGRFFRLYPAYWVSLIAALVVFFIIPDVKISTTAVLANITMLQSFMGQPLLQGIYWTLQTELVFYAICVVLFVTGHLNKLTSVTYVAVAMLTFAALLAVGRFTLSRPFPVGLPLALFVMFFGLLWRFRSSGSEEAARVCNRMIIGFVVVFPIIALLAYNQGVFEAGYDGNWHRYTMTYFVALGLFIALTTRFKITHPVFSYLGKISYSIYLLGGVVAIILERDLATLTGDWPHQLLILLCILLTVAAASVVYHLVEHPGIRLGRWIIQYLGELPRKSKISEVI